MTIYNDPETSIPTYTYMKDWKVGDVVYYLSTESNNRLAIYLVTMDNDSVAPDGEKETHVFFKIDKVIVSTNDLFVYKEGLVGGGVWPTSFYYTDNSQFGTSYLTRAAIQHLFRTQ